METELIVLVGKHLIVLLYGLCAFMIFTSALSTFAFIKLLKRSEERIDKTNDMISKMTDVAEHMESNLLIVTKAYAEQITRLQECRDLLAKSNLETAKQNTILSAAATAPRTTINNN